MFPLEVPTTHLLCIQEDRRHHSTPESSYCSALWARAMVLPRHCGATAQALAILAVFLVLQQPHGAAGFIFNSSLPLNATDLKALEAFKASMTKHDKMLNDWTDASHPCTWTGIICDCSQIYPKVPAVHACPAANPAATTNRVVFIDFGPGGRPAGKYLTGTLTPELGNFEELRNLYLHQNKLSGTVPAELGIIPHLNRLLLHFNSLTGTLPPELGKHSNIRDLYLNGNRLRGPIPQGWCQLVTRADSAHSVLNIGSNAGLCGAVPSCFTRITSSINAKMGTFLLHSDNVAGSLADNGRLSGFCDLTPPVCGPGCGVEAPAIVPSLSAFQFTFTGFDDPDNGIRGYRWGLGSAPGRADAYPMVRYAGKIGNNSTVHVQTYMSEYTSVINGATYYVTVEAENLAGPVLTTQQSSDAVIIDVTPAIPPSAAYPTLMCEPPADGVLQTSAKDKLPMCWMPFAEPETWVARYEVAVEIRAGPIVRDFEPVAYVGSKGSPPLNYMSHTMAGPSPLPQHETPRGILCFERMLTYDLTGLELLSNMEYCGVIRAWNAAGLSSVIRTHSIRVLDSVVSESNGISLGVLALIIIVLCIVSICMVGYTYRYMRARHERQIAEARENKLRAEALQAMLSSHKANNDSFGGNFDIDTLKMASLLKEAKRVCFVVTDLEGSTPASNADPRAYEQLQQTHDRIVRELITAHHGQEINTQGDSFEIVFKESSQAVVFCQELQLRLLVEPWPPRVLQLPHCEQIFGDRGSSQPLFSGPRVRIGVHVARRGERAPMACRGLLRTSHSLSRPYCRILRPTEAYYGLCRIPWPTTAYHGLRLHTAAYHGLLRTTLAY